MNFIGKNIKYLRRRANLSQEEFGNLFGLNRGNIASYEKMTEPKIEVIFAIANYFNLDVNDFVTRDLSNNIIPYKEVVSKAEVDFVREPELDDERYDQVCRKILTLQKGTLKELSTIQEKLDQIIKKA